MAGESADPAHVTYAIAQIDHALGGLYLEPFDDPAHEAGVTLTNLDRLLSSVAYGLEEWVCFEGAVAKISEAVEHLAGSKVLLASKRS
jgi:hypothetical protein